MRDIFDKPKNEYAEQARRLGIYPYFHELESRQDVEVVMEGKRRIMLGSNNYLGLTVHPRVIEAGRAALAEYGSGCSGSRFLNGTLMLHTQLERELAEFLRREAVMTFSTGFQTNLGVIAALCGREDCVLIDKEDHASIYDGCKLSYGRRLLYRHNDMDELERILKGLPEDSGKLIVTDGVFSMGGDIAKLPEIVSLAKKYGARTMVDDAHALGVIGRGGRGTADHFGLADEVDIYMGTFSKSLASLGGYMASSAPVAEYVRHTSRPFIFSASIPPASCATALAALRHLRAHPEIVDRLAEITRYVHQGMLARGIRIRESNGIIPIIPIYTKDVMTTLSVAKAIYDAGVYVNPVLPPAVPESDCLLRTSYMAIHTEALLDEALDIIRDVLVRFGIQ